MEETQVCAVLSKGAALFLLSVVASVCFSNAMQIIFIIHDEFVGAVEESSK